MNLTTIIAVSDDLQCTWQIRLFLESLKEHRFKYPVHILIFKPLDRKEWIKDWEPIEKEYQNIEFFRYEDDGSVLPILRNYHTIHRAFSLREHLKDHPELEKHALLYLDMDVVLTKELDLDDLLEDDISYGADINSYNNWTYFRGKESRVRPEKLEQYKTEDPLKQIWNKVGIDEELIKENDNNCAGVHYLIKGTTPEFWDGILNNCIPLIKDFERYNQLFIEGKTAIERKNNGWQSFCLDIWLTLWQTWKEGRKTKIDNRFNFTWSTDHYNKISETYWVHNAGIGSENQFEGGIGKSFFKGKNSYINNQVTPLSMEEQPYIDSILENEISKKYANYYYTEKIKQLYNKLNSN